MRYPCLFGRDGHAEHARRTDRLNGITVKNNAYIASYDSSVTTNPSQGNANNHGGIGSNGPIDGKNNNEIDGYVTLGPGGTINGFNVNGTTNALTAAIATPSVPTWSPTSNPNGVAQAYTVNSPTVLPGGTYWFTSLTINAALSFSDVATLNINGNVVLNTSLTAYNSAPVNLTIYQIGSGLTFGDSSGNGIDLTAVVIAPGSDFTSKNNAVLRGNVLFNTVTAKNNIEMYYDEEIGGVTGASGISSISVVK